MNKIEKMKNTFLFLFTFFLFLTVSCDKKTQKMEVVRDCTGTYLKKDGKDHYVCNESKLSSYASGDKVKVQYDVLAECFGLIDQPVCLLFHEFEDKIEITKIK